MKKIFSILLGFLIAYSIKAQISIAEARLLSEGTSVTVKGLVLNGSELGDIRYLQDATGNIAAYNSTMLDDVLRGDSIVVSGPLYNYNALLEISSTTSVTVLNSGNPLPEPLLVTCVSGFIESYEGKLLKVSDANFIDEGTFSTAGSGNNYDITDASGTSEVRILTTTNIDGTPIPTDAVSITGIMSQYAPSGTGGYQLLPRDLTDIAAPGNPPVISSILTQTNITTSSFIVNFNTVNLGNTILYYGTTTDLGSEISDDIDVLSHSINITGLTAGTIYYVKAASVSSTNDTSFSSIAAMATMSNSSGVIHEWFNTPVDNSVSTGENAMYIPNLDDSIIYYLDHAQYSIDIAVYNIDNANNIITALNDAYARGVVVRVICDAGVNDDYNLISVGSGNKKLSPTGTTPDGDYYGIMHNKFVLIDAISTDPNDAWVIAGSANMTDQQLKIDHQNVILIQDQSLVKAYKLEFDEMFSGKFGPLKSNNTPHEFIVNGKRIELYFSPSDEVETQIINQVNKADHDLYFAVFSFTRYGISYEIEDAFFDRNVFVAGIYDETDASDSTAVNVLEEALGETFFRETGSALLHHKYLIADPNCPASDPVVLTGSHNWTSSANSRNDENTLIVHDSTIANIYYQEWKARYQENGGSIFVSDEACEVVGVQPEMVINSEIKMYPNPIQNDLWVEAKIISNQKISILNMHGENVFNCQLTNKITRIELSQLATGIYILMIQDGNKMISEKIVKM